MIPTFYRFPPGHKPSTPGEYLTMRIARVDVKHNRIIVHLEWA